MSVVSRTSRRTVEAIRPPTGTQPRALGNTPNAAQHHCLPTFGEFLAEFRQDFSGWSPVTWWGLFGVLRNLESEFGEVLLSEITPRSGTAHLPSSA